VRTSLTHKHASYLHIDSFLNLACVDCALKGKVAAHFDLDINFADLADLGIIDGDANPFNVARLRLETLEAIAPPSLM